MWWKKYAPSRIDYGHGFKGRKLYDGTYVLERKNIRGAWSLNTLGMRHLPGTYGYVYCIAPSAKELNKAAKKIIAFLGI